MEARSLTKIEPVTQQDQHAVTGKHLIRATACSYPPAVQSEDVLFVDADCRDIFTDGLYLLERIEAGRVVWMGCRRFELSISGEVRIDESGDGQVSTFDSDARSLYRIAGRVMQVFKPCPGTVSHSRSHEKGSTFHPLIGMCDGTIKRLAGGLSHGDAMAAAARAAVRLENVDFTGAGMDRCM